MFTLGSKETFEWPVKLRLPVDGGKYEDSTFTAIYKRISQERITELLAQGRAAAIALATGATTDTGIKDADVVKEILVGWKEVQDNDSKPWPFNPANVAHFCSIPSVASSIVSTFFDAVGGGKRKN